MGVEQIHSEFLDLESEYELFDRRLDGVPVWERVRFEIYRKVLYGTVWEQAHTRSGSSPSDFGRRLWLGLRNVAFRNPFLAGEHEFLFLGHERRKRQDDGTWWDVYCDPLYAALDLDYLHLERPHLDRHFTPARTDNLRYLDSILVGSGLLRRAIERSGATALGKTRDARAFHEVGTELESRFGVEVNVPEIVGRSLAERSARKPLYERLIRRVDPEVSVLVTSYGKETFVEACQDWGVSVVELQHGIIDDTAVAYSFPGDRTKTAFPDYLFTFGEFWNERAAFPIPDERVVPVGYPHLERSRRTYVDVESSETVLFVSQGIVGTELSRMAVELAADPRVDADVVYKVHPGEHERWRSAYPWLAEADVEVVDQSGRPLYRLFAESSVQVGVSSTALYEGLAFDLDTYVVDLTSVEFVNDLLENDYATLVADADELATCLTEPTDRSVDVERLFRSGSVERIGTELRRIAADDR